MSEGFVLLGDVVRSSRIQDPWGFQRRLWKLVQTLNHKFSAELAAEFKILKGIDEIAAVLRSLRPIAEVVSEMFFSLYPVMLRVVVVYGEITVGFATGDVSRMDGPSFHEAAELMEELKRERLFFRLKASSVLLDRALTGLVNALLLLKTRWTPEQVRLIQAYRRLGSQREVASQWGISQQAVSERLRRALWPEIQRLEHELKELLQEYQELQDGSGALITPRTRKLLQK